ncbi:penicillin-binding protein 2 [Rhodanobacter glycinis]|jgi:penicillin-binding protein 2|uniref:Peptidoglycan D,D-transpeptidase MrdA n=1 Tax=Rhodanobacter glycinis TaxID=582702 RepID=A0A1I4D6P4_9GAMM|nr:penicillin-binding protein 2 [Rhodanobacter glycinis]SFK89424.1 peptidoglycan glycosyltransferase [Rhodanobacter glycinis]
MQQRRSIKDHRSEGALFRRRALVGFALILLGLCALVSRYVYLQVARHDEFVTRSVNNRVKPRVLPPPRGLIYDRNGVLLADNVPAFRLEVVPEQVKDMKAMLAQLGMVVPLSQDDIDSFLKQVKQSRRFDSVPLKLHLTEDEIDRFAVNRWRFPGVDVVPYLTRNYPLGSLFAHVVGYVGRIDADDMKKLDEASYKGTTHVGRIGIERSYESVLHGTPGYELDEVNANGRVQRVLETHPPSPGKNLYLSIDARIQKAAEKAFDGRPGAAVAIDPRNGQVLAMVSVPTFDPNLFVDGISAADYHALLYGPDKPLFNRAISGVYPPGSTVKPLLALGGLELGLRTPEDTVLSTGVFYIPGQKRGYRDDRRGGFGTVNMKLAIMWSVNTYFYKLALDMGIDRFSKWMGRFGFGKPTGIDLDNEAAGVLPSRAWKSKHFRQPWYPGETVIAGIGQGYWAVTPLQLAHAIATLAGHGVPYAPRLVMSEQSGENNPPVPLVNPPTGPSLVTSEANWNTVEQGMQMVVNDPRGTGYGLGKGFPYTVAGKSGTAERYSRTTDAYNTNKSTAYLASRHRAWFEMFAPAEHPRIAVAVVLESGAWGAADAGPIARKILDAWLSTQKDPPPDTPLPESRTKAPPPSTAPAPAPTGATP